MIIGIDLDDVLANFMDTFLSYAHARYGRPAIGSAPIDWEWSNVLPDKNEQAAVWSDALDNAHFWENLEVNAGVTPAVVQELDQKHTLYFPTARVETKTGMSVRKQSAYWLQERLGVWFPTVIVAYEKGPMATALKYDYFIDDRPKNCLDIKAALPNCKVYLKDASHNRQFQILHHPSIEGTVKTFDEFAKIILEG